MVTNLRQLVFVAALVVACAPKTVLAAPDLFAKLDDACRAVRDLERQGQADELARQVRDVENRLREVADRYRLAKGKRRREIRDEFVRFATCLTGMRISLLELRAEALTYELDRLRERENWECRRRFLNAQLLVNLARLPDSLRNAFVWLTAPPDVALCLRIAAVKLRLHAVREEANADPKRTIEHLSHTYLEKR